MDRQSVINKIKAMLALQESTDFEGEAAAAAAALIEKLCKQHGINPETVNNPEILDEVFQEFKKMNSAIAMLLNSVANFYDACAYISRKDNKSLNIIGSEAQIIQTRLYFEYLYETMEKEAEKAFLAEKVLADLTGFNPPTKSFKHNFRLAFAQNVQLRLKEMKDKEHEHAKFTKDALALRKFGKAKTISSGSGDGAHAGYSAGSTVSLNKQANGASHKFLSASQF
jgi:hypothetical protein